MLTFRKLFCFSLLAFVVCGNIISKQPFKYKVIANSPQYIPECEQDKSLNSRNDIKVMIDHVYKEKSVEELIKQNYQSQAVEIRNKHLQDLTDFTRWFENQPEHLKHVLERLGTIRKSQVEPVIEITAGVIKEYPYLEKMYTERNNKTNDIVNKFNRYNMICKFNCEDQQIKEQNIVKRNAKDELYCSSLEDLHKDITEKLDKYIKKINNATTSKLFADDEKYREKINEIKSKLKDKALKEFGRTMYDILNLEDEYDHFMNDMTSTDLLATVYSIKSLGLQIDGKLLELEQAVDKFGQFCNTCGSKSRVRSVREAILDPKGQEEKESSNLVNELLEIKFHDVTVMVENDYENIYSDLNTLIQKTESQEFTLDKLKPIQEEVSTMTNAEKEVLSKLKLKAPKFSIQNILKLVKKLMDLLKNILEILNKLNK